MTSVRAINAGGDVIRRSMDNGRKLPISWAADLDAAGLLQSPEIAAELVELRKLPEQLREALARVAELEALVGDGSTRPVDEDPIAYALTPAAEDVAPQVAKLRGILAGQRASLEDPHDDPVGLHHDYQIPHDLPEVRP